MPSLVSMVYHFPNKQYNNVSLASGSSHVNVNDMMHGAGTAGVWRISALNEAGGWKDRTTVEDMDLAVRAGLKGGKFVYLSDLKVSLKHAAHLVSLFILRSLFNELLRKDCTKSISVIHQVSVESFLLY